MAAVEAADKLEIPGNKELSELSDHINQKHRVNKIISVMIILTFIIIK